MHVEVFDETSHVNKSNIKYIRRKIRFKNTNDFYNLINCDNTKNKKFIVVVTLIKKLLPYNIWEQFVYQQRLVQFIYQT